MTPKTNKKPDTPQNTGTNKWAAVAGDRTTEEQAWDDRVLQHVAAPHFMQSSLWARTKVACHWPATRVSAETPSGAFPLQLMYRSLPVVGKLYYAPEVTGVNADNLPSITKQLRAQIQDGLAVKMELYQPYSDELIAAFEKNGWQRANSVQPRDTVVVDLSGSIDEVFGRMKKRARYEVRSAEKNGVVIERVNPTPENLAQLTTMIATTAKRTGAFFRSADYTNRYWRAFADNNFGSLYFAKHGKILLAATYVIRFGKTAWYKDSGSIREGGQLMAPRLMLWQIMKDLHADGVTKFDLSGIPAPEEAETSHMKGLFVFKTGFTNETTRFMPAMELPLSSRYPLWAKLEPHILHAYAGFTKDFWY